MTNSIDKRLWALDNLVKLLSMLTITYKKNDLCDSTFILKLEDNDDNPFEFIVYPEELDALMEVLGNIKPMKDNQW